MRFNHSNDGPSLPQNVSPFQQKLQNGIHSSYTNNRLPKSSATLSTSTLPPAYGFTKFAWQKLFVVRGLPRGWFGRFATWLKRLEKTLICGLTMRECRPDSAMLLVALRRPARWWWIIMVRGGMGYG